jgi:iron complex transport system substrate-binding protein
LRKRRPQTYASSRWALTEIVYRLRAEALLVATDTTSFYPAAAAALPKVGYQRTLSAEGVLSLRPTVVLVTADAGPPAALAQLQSAGVRIVRAEMEHSFDWLRRTVQLVAREIGRADAGKRLNGELAAQWQAAQAAITTKSGARPRVLFVLSHAGPWPAHGPPRTR